jgi:hypothetical protein
MLLLGQCRPERAEPRSSHSVGSERLRLVGLAALPIEMASLPAAKPIGADDVGICSAGFLAATSVLARLTAQLIGPRFLPRPCPGIAPLPMPPIAHRPVLILEKME